MKIDEKLIQEITQMVCLELKKMENKKVVSSKLREKGIAQQGKNPDEVVIGVAPSFNKNMVKTIQGLDHDAVLKEIMAGIEEEGMIPRVIRVLKTSDVAFVAKEAAILSGSGIGIGIQSKGTTVIHQKDLYPLSNLELFPQAPLITLDMYRSIGKNAAMYAKGKKPIPIEVKSDHNVRAKYQVKAALMHIKETETIEKNKPSLEIDINL